MIPGQTWEILWQLPFVLAALLLNETIRHWFISACGHLPPPEQPTRLTCLWPPKDWPTEMLYSHLPERAKWKGLCDASKKSDFQQLVYYLVTKLRQKRQKESISYEPWGSQSQIFRRWLSKERQNFAPSVTVSSEDLISRPLGLVRPKNLSY